MSDQTIFQRALDLYTPPFNFNRYGYLNDSKSQMVADNHVEDSVEETGKEAMLRVRGWGRISYLPEPEKLQDQIGEILGQALTEFWLKHGGVECLQAIPSPDRLHINKRGEVTEQVDGKYVLHRDYQIASTTLGAAINLVSDQENLIKELQEELRVLKGGYPAPLTEAQIAKWEETFKVQEDQ